MLVFILLGAMNIPATAGPAAVIFAEKPWRLGPAFPDGDRGRLAGLRRTGAVPGLIAARRPERRIAGSPMGP